MSADLAKHALLVEPKDGKLSGIAPVLRTFGFELVSVADVSAARAIVATSRLLSLVAIDCAIGEEAGAALLKHIKDEHSELPVVWVGTRSSPAPVSESGHAPDIFIQHPADPALLREDVEHLLWQHAYPQPLRDHLERCCRDAMRRSYTVELTLAGTYLRANRSALGGVTAILPFVGRRLSGRLLVGTERSVLAAIRRRALVPTPPATDAEIDDMAGEFANVVVGRVKEHFVLQGLDFVVGTPVVVSGEGNTLSYRGSRPTLVQTFRSEVGDVRVALCFDVLGGGDATLLDAESRTVVETGEIVFL
jgi:chemotaxis protein CheX